jgi:hypothetical protein
MWRLQARKVQFGGSESSKFPVFFPVSREFARRLEPDCSLSRPGATMSDGESMAERVTGQDHLVLIELGGNDLIAGEPFTAFSHALDGTLAKWAAPGRTLVMFELPLLPNRVEYGQIQRRLCVKYRVWLIPKRFLTEVIAGRDATSDGLHLTDAGAGAGRPSCRESLHPF